MTAPADTLSRADSVIAGDSVCYRGLWYRVNAIHIARRDVRYNVTPYNPRDRRRYLYLRRRELLEVTHV